MIVSKCPLRVSLAGGSTDLQQFIDKYGYGKVLSFPITLYTYISISKRFDGKYKIDYSQQEEVKDPNDIKNDIARELITYFDLPPITIAFNADIPTTGSGLASSSSYMVAAVAAACKFKNLNWSQFRICQIAHEIELKFNPLTGYQDTYGCGLPSSKIMTFNNNINVKFISIPNINMFLYNTNIKRSSTEILKTINVEKSYKLLELVNEIESTLSNNINKFWELLCNSWETKKNTSQGIITSKISQIEDDIKLDSKVKYYKLCGAGGGGYFLIMTEDSKSLKNSIKIDIDNKGVVVWEI